VAVFCIIIIIIVVVVIVIVTAVGIIWPEVPDHRLGDRRLIFVRNFLSSPWALGAPSLCPADTGDVSPSTVAVETELFGSGQSPSSINKP
jgi:hypothetical protein